MDGWMDGKRVEGGKRQQAIECGVLGIGIELMVSGELRVEDCWFV